MQEAMIKLVNNNQAVLNSERDQIKDMQLHHRSDLMELEAAHDRAIAQVRVDPCSTRPVVRLVCANPPPGPHPPRRQCSSRLGFCENSRCVRARARPGPAQLPDSVLAYAASRHHSNTCCFSPPFRHAAFCLS